MVRGILDGGRIMFSELDNYFFVIALHFCFVVIAMLFTLYILGILRTKKLRNIMSLAYYL